VMTELDATRLVAFARDGALSPELRAAMTRAAALRTELDRRNAAVKESRERRDRVVADQARIRENLGAVPSNSELQRRYLAQLQQQENDLAGLAAQLDAAQRAAAEAEAAWKAFVQGLTT
jgi:septal ring factor EnvC (AmiA/AmiB activator)